MDSRHTTIDGNAGISIPIDSTAVGNTYTIPVTPNDAMLIQMGDLIQLTNDSPLAFVKGTVTAINSGVLVSGTTDAYWTNNFDLQVTSFDDGSSPSTVYITGSNTYIDYADGLIVLGIELANNTYVYGQDMHSHELRKKGIYWGAYNINSEDPVKALNTQITNTFDTSVMVPGDSGTLNLNWPIMAPWYTSGDQTLTKVKDYTTFVNVTLSNYDVNNLTVDYVYRGGSSGGSSQNVGIHTGWNLDYQTIIPVNESNGTAKIKFHFTHPLRTTTFGISGFITSWHEPGFNSIYVVNATMPNLKDLLIGQRCYLSFGAGTFSGVLDLSDSPSSFNDAHDLYPACVGARDANDYPSSFRMYNLYGLTDINYSGSRISSFSMYTCPDTTGIDFTDFAYSKQAFENTFQASSFRLGDPWSSQLTTNLSEASCQQFIDLVISGVYNHPPNWNDTYTTHPWIPEPPQNSIRSFDLTIRSPHLTAAQISQIDAIRTKTADAASKVPLLVIKESNN